jgi:putative endonuclease
MKKGRYTYILTDTLHTVLYIGVTSCLERRLYQHRNNLIPEFTSKYRIQKLVYYERHELIEDAILPENN